MFDIIQIVQNCQHTKLSSKLDFKTLFYVKINAKKT